MRIHSLHQRLAAPVDEVAALLDGLGSGRDRLWPKDRWPPLLLDRPLAVGAAGGHGPIRHHVEELEPGRIRFRFSGPRGLTGIHEFIVDEAVAGCRLRHIIDAEARGRILLKWPMIRTLHDALMEDALDCAELAVTGQVAATATWPLRVRLRRRFFRGRRSGR